MNSTNVSPLSTSGCEADFLLDLAGIRLRFSIPNPSARQEFISFIPPTAPRDGSTVLLLLAWSGLVCRVQPGSRCIQAQSAELIPALTHILMLERLRVQVDDLVIVHGNALFDSRTRRPILLLGHSGSGKSTLSRLLLQSDRFSLIAEDTLLIQLRTGILHPYPRASSLRISRDVESHLPTWRGIRRGGQRKVLVQPQRVHPDPVDLINAMVFDLQMTDKVAEPDPIPTVSGEEIFSLSHADQALTSHLDEAFPGARMVLGAEGEIPMAILPRRLLGRDRARLIELFARHRAMVLASQAARTFPSAGVKRRPIVPSAVIVGAIDGLQAVLKHETHHAAPDIPERDPSRTLMQLAHLFSRASFHSFIPGGTPQESTRLLVDLLESGRLE